MSLFKAVTATVFISVLSCSLCGLVATALISSDKSPVYGTAEKGANLVPETEVPNGCIVKIEKGPETYCTGVDKEHMRCYHELLTLKKDCEIVHLKKAEERKDAK